MRKTRFYVTSVLLGAMYVAGGIPMAQGSYEVQTMTNALNRLQNQLNTLEKYVYRHEGGVPNAPAAPTSAVNSSGDKIATLEKQVQDLTDQVERNNHALTTVKHEFEAYKKDTDLRIKELTTKKGAVPDKVADKKMTRSEKSTSSASDQKTDKPTKKIPSKTQDLTLPSEPASDHVLHEDASKEADRIAQNNPVPTHGAMDQYNDSVALLQKKEYGPALKGFESFIKNNPDHDMVQSAQHKIGEIHQVLGDHTKASVAFLESYKKGAKSAKAPESLLQLAISLQALNKNKEACATFEKLLADFPKADIALRQQAEDGKAAACLVG